jgi:hypothetical protein
MLPLWLTLLGVLAGVLGGLAGIVSLVWQIATWRRSSHNVKVTTSQAWFTFSDGTFSEDMLAVTIFNTGSSAVTVTGWGIEMESHGASLNVIAPIPGSTPLPHRLESGAEMNVHIRAQDLRNAHGERKVPFKQMRAWARLATGRRVFAKPGVQVSPSPA